MTWRNVLPMEERTRFVLEAVENEYSISELCRYYEISRRTGYKWLRRFKEEGLEGLKERSRRPKRLAKQTSEAWVGRILEEKSRHPKWGPKKIRRTVKGVDLGESVPAASTIGAILDRYGLVQKRRRRGRAGRTYRGSLTEVQRANQVWAVDFKGWFRTGDGRRCEPLTVSDLYSRYVLCVRVMETQKYWAVRKEFERLFKEYGLPEAIRCDNGVPFATTGVGRLSRLSVWWICLGIRPEFIAPGHPEQNGVHERMHRTLKQEACSPPAGNRSAQQRRFNGWREQFNDHRPHEALDLEVPALQYRLSVRKYTQAREQFDYPPSYAVRRVSRSGEIRWKKDRRFVSEALRWKNVGLKPVAEGRYEVYFGPILVGLMDEKDSGRLRPAASVAQSLSKKEANV